LKNKANPVLTSEQARVFLPLAPSFGLLPPDQPAVVENLLVSLHARATDLLHSRGSHVLLGDLAGLPARIRTGIKNMKPGALGEFLIEVARGAARSPEVSGQLARSAAIIRRGAPGLSFLEKPATVLFRESGSDDVCACEIWSCDPRGGLPDGVGCVGICQPIWVCLIIVIVIVIVIILGALD